MNKISKTLYNLYNVYNLFKLKNIIIKPYDSLLIFNSLLGIKSDLVTELAEFIQNFDSDITIATYYLTAFSVWFSQSKKPYLFNARLPRVS